MTMAERKSSGFRFRLPWLLQPALAPSPAIAPEPPRTTVQTSVASTSKPPFRPPGRAPAPVAPPPSLATSKAPPQSTSSPVSIESPPPPPPPPPTTPVEAKSSVPKSPITKTIDSVATQSTKETQKATGAAPITETTSPAAEPPPFRAIIPPQPSSPAKPNSEPSSPSRTTHFRNSSPPVSPSRMPTPPRSDFKPLSSSRLATPPHVATKPSSPPATQSQPISHLTSPVHVPPPPPSPSPPPATVITANTAQEVFAIPDNTPRSPEITHEKFPVDLYHVPQGSDDLAVDSKPKEITKMKGLQTKSMNPHSMEAKSPKSKPKFAGQIPLHREIKDDISKFIRNLATSSPKQSMDEKPASIITLAGENRGASMHLGSDPNKGERGVDIQRRYKLNDVINGEGTSDDKKSQRDSRSGDDEETKAIVNSNIQGINNSIMFNSSVKERNPGVHLKFSRTLANTDSIIEDTEKMEMYKAEADFSPSDTLVYEPTMERSFGGFFMEATCSESDDFEMSGKVYEIQVL